MIEEKHKAWDLGTVKARFALMITATLALAATASSGQTAASGETWVTSWGSSQLLPYGNETLPPGSFEGATLREVVHLSVGGPRVRLLLANTFGREPLVLRSVQVELRSVGLPGKASPSTSLAVLFHGSTSATVPEEAEMLSDPVSLAVPAGADLAVTMVIEHAPVDITFHAGAHATAFLTTGVHASDKEPTQAKTVTRWYFLSGVEVSGSPSSNAVIALGDSITDGHGATTDGNDRWPDLLARRLQQSAATQNVAVVNEGIGGNCVLRVCLGPNALARFDRDVLARPGAAYVIVLEGINDIGGLDRTEDHPAKEHDALVSALEMAFTQMALRAHAHGLRLYGATLTPFRDSGYYHPSDRTEADRQALNEWIRHSSTFDGVIDFDAALRDPARPDHLLPAADSGDHLHPGPAGYARMANAVPLSLFRPDARKGAE